VVVLDDAPAELVRLVGYLQSIAPELVIDLVAVTAYEVNGTRMLVPQRVDSDRPSVASTPRSASPQKTRGHLVPPEEFKTIIADAPAADRAKLQRVYEWATDLEARGHIRLLAYRGATGRTNILPYIHGDEAGLVTVWNDAGPVMALWRSVFERRAPKSIEKIEALISPMKIGKGNVVRDVSDELLAALTAAYEEAAS
jgi:hypothetical protein